TQAVVSPDGQLLAAVIDFGGVGIWDLSTAKIKTTIKGQAEGVLAVAFSPDGKRLAAGNTKDTFSLWELASRRERTLGGHGSTVFAVAFSHDGTLLASGSRDRTVKVWDVARGAQIATLTGPRAAVTSVVFSSDGRLLAAAISD